MMRSTFGFLNNSSNSVVFLKTGIVLLFFMYWPTNALADFEKIKVAVLPFTLQGEAFPTDDMGAIVSEWLTTAFVQDGRFEVVERKLLGQVLEEQKMVEFGIVSQEKATELGKLLGAKVIVSGSVMKLRGNIEVNARLIDVSSTSIITAGNTRCREKEDLKRPVLAMAEKLIRDFPLDGYIIDREENRVVIDLGRLAGVKEGMQFKVYEEGEPLRHPKTNEILSIKKVQTGIIRVTDVEPEISNAIIVEESHPDAIRYGAFVKSLAVAAQENDPAGTREKDGTTRATATYNPLADPGMGLPSDQALGNKAKKYIDTYSEQKPTGRIPEETAGSIGGNREPVPQTEEYTSGSIGGQKPFEQIDTDPADQEGTGGLESVSVSRRSITITFWNQQQQDNDTINLYLNGMLLASNIVLNRNRQTRRLQLRGGKNLFEIEAINEGRVPPNIATIEISDIVSGSRIQQSTLKTGQRARMNIYALN